MSAGNLAGQQNEPEYKGIHQEESENYSRFFPSAKDSEESSIPQSSDDIRLIEKNLRCKVLGWHPYWASSDAHQRYDYGALTHIAYFSYEVDTATGGYTTIRGWNTTPIIDYAHQRGTKVLLTVTNFGSSKNTEILSDTIKQNFLLSTLIPLLKTRNADGVNFDLETVSSSQKNNLVGFMQRAAKEIKREMPDAEISMATPAVDWSGAWDYKRLSQICDYLIIMGYNYYWSTSSTAGPVAPLYNESQNVSKSVITYLTAGVPPEKLFIGVPWYGYDWPVTDQSRKSAATGPGTSRTLAAAEALANQHSRKFDNLTAVPWVSYSSGGWRQMWFDDLTSLGMKFEYAMSKDLGGIGIWALSYEGNISGIWTTIKNELAAPSLKFNSISRIYPNPSSETIEIDFVLTTQSDILLRIYDPAGRIIKTIADGTREAGAYTETFNASGHRQGIYLCVLKAGNKISTEKILIIK